MTLLSPAFAAGRAQTREGDVIASARSSSNRLSRPNTVDSAGTPAEPSVSNNTFEAASSASVLPRKNVVLPDPVAFR